MANLLTTQGFKGEEPLSLTALEYKLLILFMNNPFKTMKRDDILAGITRDGEVFFDENTLSVYIKRLREKIEIDPKLEKELKEVKFQKYLTGFIKLRILGRKIQ